MEIKWNITSTDVVRVKELLRAQDNNPFVRKRRATNLATFKSEVERDRFWFQMVAARLSSAQRSGPNSYVTRFLSTVPFPLGYTTILTERDRAGFIAEELKNARGIRSYNRIAEDLAANLLRLENGTWVPVLEQCNRLTVPASSMIEREVAAYIDGMFRGFGPKQSRNLLQSLGLTRYEIPIDSRVTKWLNDFGFPFQLSAQALKDWNYYNFVSDGVQKLCKKCDEFPCILDAAIFALKDGDAWTDANLVY